MQHFPRPLTWAKLLTFTFPTILMMLFLSLYTTVDGIMVSRLVSENALAAVNIVFPVVSLILAIALMFSSGANAIIAFHLGEKNTKKAREKLSATYCYGFIVSLGILAIGTLFMDPIIRLLGTSDSLSLYAKPYLSIMLIFTPMIFFQIFTQTFLVTEGKPLQGLLLSLASGVINIVLDYIFIAHFRWGISGAALATGLGYTLTGTYGLLYFGFHKHAVLKLAKPSFDWSFFLKTTTNGASEMVSNLAIAFTTFLFNITMLRLIGNDGVVAITIILYVQFIQMAIYFGYSQGVSPLISYLHGSKETQELQMLIRKSFVFIFVASALVIALSYVFLEPLIQLFVTKGTPVFDITKEGFTIFLVAYVFMGFNVFMSAMFTALGNGRVSATLSFLRTFVFITGALLLLPNAMGLLGVWIAVPLSECLSFGCSVWAYLNGDGGIRAPLSF